MNERLANKKLRSTFSQIGWVMLAYYGIMNLSVLGVDFTQIIYRTLKALAQGSSMSRIEQIYEDVLMSNGWGYLLAVAIGALILRLWKGRSFCYQVIWQRENEMEAGAFFSLLAIFVSGQLLFQIFGTWQEWMLNLFGYSALKAFESATMQVNTLSMFLYVALIGPVAEEILFRGFILRTLQPYGKRFAILLSALLFGVYHGNIVQAPFAFAIGLVLGYTAIEYSILWAIILHVFNNFVLSVLLDKLTAPLPEEAAGAILMLIIIGFSIAAVCIAAVRRGEISAYIRGNRVEKRYVKAFFGSVGIIILLIVMQLFAACSIMKI